MFKKYRLEWEEEYGKTSIDFFVNSKKTRSGFMHRACVIGMPPRLDSSMSNWSEYKSNDAKLNEKRVAKVFYVNRSWEPYQGQECLAKLWDQLAKLKFVDMGRISKENPFERGEEPENEDLWEPDVLFDGFKRRLT